LYLLKLSISLSIVWIFYQLFLRRLTFYGWNRWYLLGYSVLSFFIPLINIEGLVDKNPAGEAGVVEYIPAIGQYMASGPFHPAAVVATPFDWTGAVLWMIGAGAVVLLIRMLVRWLSLVRIRRSARMVEWEGLRIYEIGEDIRPFSFGSAVYINPQLHTEKEWEEIILHEYVHIRQRHTIDILLAELVCILNWYNPFSWLIRRSIRQNLEFIADRQVLGSGVDRVGYQYHLLKVLGETRYRLANNFNFSSLKKRIIMMNKMRSARLHLLKFLFVLPLVGVLLVAFRDAAEVGRTTVEKLYGGLPERVPPPGSNTDGQGKAARSGGKIVIGSGVIGVVGERIRKDTMPKHPGSAPSLSPQILYVVDGEKMPVGWDLNMLPADLIGTRVYMNSAKALTFFGPRGANGAVVIRTKAYEAAHPFIVVSDEKRGTPAVLFDDSVLGKRPPLLVVDGQIWPNDLVQKLNPNEIKSITVHKSEEYTKQYGDEGKNGVIEITLKPKGTGAGPYRSGSITMNGESHVEGNGQAIGVANGPREGQAQVIFDNGKQIAIADTIKMNGLIITTYHPGGN
jgi:beta-lactamase regulating signal transducer with metallopeptidase domain